MPGSLDKWTYFQDLFPRKDRVACLHAIQLERTVARNLFQEGDPGQLTGLTINVSNHGICVLLDWFPETGEVLRVHMPMPVPASHTPTLADVRWVKVVPFRGRNLTIAGLRFLI